MRRFLQMTGVLLAMLSIIVAIVAAFASTANAGTVAVITSDAGSGSAFAIHRDADGSVIWCTANHCVGGTVRIAGTSATVVYQSQADDLAFVRTPSSVTANLVELSDAEPGEGIAHGYPDRVFQSIPGGVEIVPAEEDCSDNGRIYRVVRCRMLAPCPPGMSGGVIVQRQRTVGMVTASGGGRTLYVSALKIRYHLTQCFGGQCRQPQYWVTPRPSVPYIQPPIVWTQPQYSVTPVQPQPSPLQVPDDTRERLDAIERALQQVAESMPTATQGPPGERGPVGLVGPQGPAGPTGLQGPGPTDSQVAAAVATWMQANATMPSGGTTTLSGSGLLAVYISPRDDSTREADALVKVLEDQKFPILSVRVKAQSLADVPQLYSHVSRKSTTGSAAVQDALRSLIQFAKSVTNE